MLSAAWHQMTRDIPSLTRPPDVRVAFDRAAARLEANHMFYLLPFFAQLGETYAKWVDELPGSERYHHAHPHGLIVHAAETVEWAFAIRGDLMDTFMPVWHEVLLTVALLHDCGRLFEVEVEDPHDEVFWDPLRQPLALFRETRYLEPGYPVRWRSGRGLQAHEDRFFDLVPLLLGGEVGMEFLSALSRTWSRYLDRRRDVETCLDPYPYALAQVVAAADQHSVREDLRRRKASPRPPPGPSNAPVFCYSSPALPRRTFPGGSGR
jgi:hypothetical protein